MKLKKILYSSPNKSIGVGLVLGSLFCLFMAYLVIKPSAAISDLFTNLAASGITAFFTVAYIEAIRGSSHKIITRDGRLAALEDITFAGNASIAWIAPTFKMNAMQYKFDPDNVTQSGEAAISSINDSLLKLDIERLLTALSPPEWKQLIDALDYIHTKLSDHILHYRDYDKDEVLACVVAGRRSIAKLRHELTLLPVLLTKPESEWPDNTNGISANRSLRNIMIKSTAEDLELYFQVISKLRLAISQWRIDEGI